MELPAAEVVRLGQGVFSIPFIGTFIGTLTDPRKIGQVYHDGMVSVSCAFWKYLQRSFDRGQFEGGCFPGE